MNLLAALEGLLFLCGDDGLQIEDVQTILEIDKEKVEELANQLLQDYRISNRGIKLEKYGNIYKLVTKSEYNDFYKN